MNWNTSYTTGRDYSQLSTSSLDQLLEMAEVTLPILAGRQPASLDIGCGTGQLVRDLYHRGFNSHGIDISEVALEIARKSTVRMNGSAFRYGNVLEDSFEEMFDLITCKYVYTFIEQSDVFLGRIRAILRSGGVLVIITPDPSHLPENKKSIATKPEAILEAASKHFGTCKQGRIGNDFIITCR